MSGDSFTLTSGIMYGGGIAGVQIVEIPEPATMILLGLGGLLLRRKK